MATKPTNQPDPFLSESSLPSAERIQQELATAESIDDFFGKDGIITPPTTLQNGW